MQNAKCKVQNSPYGDKYSRLFSFALLPKTHYFDICFCLFLYLFGGVLDIKNAKCKGQNAKLFVCFFAN